MITESESELIDALSVVDAIMPHAESGWLTERFAEALKKAQAKAAVALDAYMAES